MVHGGAHHHWGPARPPAPTCLITHMQCRPSAAPPCRQRPSAATPWTPHSARAPQSAWRGPLWPGLPALPPCFRRFHTKCLCLLPVWRLGSALHSVACPPAHCARAAMGCAGVWLHVLWAPCDLFWLGVPPHALRHALCNPGGGVCLSVPPCGLVGCFAELMAAVCFCVPPGASGVARLTSAGELGVHSRCCNAFAFHVLSAVTRRQWQLVPKRNKQASLDLQKPQQNHAFKLASYHTQQQHLARVGVPTTPPCILYSSGTTCASRYCSRNASSCTARPPVGAL